MDRRGVLAPSIVCYSLACLAAVLAVLQLPRATVAAGGSPSGSGEGDGSSSGGGSSTISPAPAGSVPLNFIFLSSNNPTLRTSGSIPAVDIALEMVEKSGILGKYRLQYTEALDSYCDRTQALDMFHAAVRRRDGEEFVQNIAIIGAGCSVATLPVAEICHYYNLPILSWSSAAAQLSDHDKFKSNYRLAPSEKNYSPGMAALLRHYKWKQIAILTQMESLFLASQRLVIHLLPEVNFVTREFASDKNPLKTGDFFVNSLDMRVFVLNMYVDHARTILCEAVRREMFYPRYLWVTPGWYGDLWWEKELPDGCTLEDMEKVLSHSLSAVQYPVFSETEKSSVGISTEDFRKTYGTLLYYLANVVKVRNYTIDLTAPLAFDAVWTLTKALRMTIDKVESGEEGRCANVPGELVPLEQFDYGNDKLGCLLLESLDQIYFLGISGNVTFDKSGDRVGNTVRISQYQPGKGRERMDGSDTRHMATPLVGYALFETDGENITGLDVNLINENASVTWPDGITPDGIPKMVTVSTALALTVIYYLLASVGIIFAFICLLFNIIFRKRKIVRLTSPNLNYLIILGAVLLYMSVFFWVSPAEEEMEATVLCNFRIWLFSIGNTLCLAVVLSKMWRVHYIFTSPSPKRKPKPPQDWHLLIIISVLVSVDLVILLIPTAIEQSRSHGQLTESKEHGVTEDELGVVQIHSYYSCYSDSQLIWLFMSYIYKFLLQIAAIYFAFMSRKIRVKALNDSKEITAIIYITSLLLVISAFGFWIGLLYLNTSTLVFGLAQLLTATVILGLLFIPKMVSLRLDPQGTNIFSGGHHTTTASVNQSSIDVLESNQKMVELSTRVKELESELEKYQNGSTNLTALYTCNTTTPTQTSPDSKLRIRMEPEP